MPKLIRVLEYNFETEEDLQRFYESANNGVPWNGTARMGPTRSISSLTFRPDLSTFEHGDDLHRQVYEGLASAVLQAAPTIVAVDAEGRVQVVKYPSSNPLAGFDFAF